MSKPFPDLRTDEEAEDWLQNADLTEYDLSDMKKARFELAPKDATISLRLAAALLATLKTRAAEANMPTQRFIRVLIEAQLGGGKPKGSRSRGRAA
jgi:predicted DNA binding CopG/RHH family protein